MRSVVFVRPFPLYLLNQVTFDLVLLSVGHESQGQAERSMQSVCPARVSIVASRQYCLMAAVVCFCGDVIGCELAR